jgi:hypothetical protein
MVALIGRLLCAAGLFAAGASAVAAQVVDCRHDSDDRELGS